MYSTFTLLLIKAKPTIRLIRSQKVSNVQVSTESIWYFLINTMFFTKSIQRQQKPQLW